jgi:6-phosphogluconolactonase
MFMSSARRGSRLIWFAVLALAAALAFVPRGRSASKAGGPGRAALYAAAGAELIQFDADLDNATLTQRGSVQLPENIQEAWPHPSHKVLYVTWSTGATGYTPPGQKSPHGMTAFRIDPATGALQQHGEPISLTERAVFMTSDIDGKHVLVAYPDPSAISVHAIKPDLTLGPPVAQKTLDVGVYAHQVRVDPSNKAVILITRGNGPTPTKAEDPGAIKVFKYDRGVLTNEESVAPGGGFDFQVRHLDFHPSGKWVYVTLERQDKLFVFQRSPDGTLGQTPLFRKDPLANPESKQRQAVSSIHVHPNGRFVYVANRAGGTVEFEGKRVFAGGENSIAVFAINQETGEPTLIQNADTRGMGPRTFTLDATGRMLVVANQSSGLVRIDRAVSVVPACLSVFRVGSDGKLDFVRKYDIETGGARSLFWAGFVAPPN